MAFVPANHVSMAEDVLLRGMGRSSVNVAQDTTERSARMVRMLSNSYTINNVKYKDIIQLNNAQYQGAICNIADQLLDCLNTQCMRMFLGYENLGLFRH